MSEYCTMTYVKDHDFLIFRFKEKNFCRRLASPVMHLLQCIAVVHVRLVLQAVYSAFLQTRFITSRYLTPSLSRRSSKQIVKSEVKV